MLRFLFCLLFVSFSFYKMVWAHFLWINPRAYCLQPGEELRLTLGFGHNFPGAGGDFLEAHFLKTLKVFSPSGKEIPIKEGKYPILFKSVSVLQENGSYIVLAEKKPSFFSKTAWGFVRKPKNKVQDVIECKFSKRYAKALIQVEKAKGEIYRRIFGQELEIIPLKNPSTLKPGDELPLKVIYQGHPLAKEFLFATYEGFSPTGNKTFFAFATRTDAQGKVRIRLDHRGVWLLLVALKKPYSKAEVCDVETVVATFTFELR